MPVGYEFGGPFTGQGEIGTGSTLAMPLFERQLEKVRRLSRGLDLHPEFHRATRQLAIYCLDEAQRLGPNVPEVREGLVLECSKHFDDIFQAHLTVDVASEIKPYWFQLKLPTPELLRTYFGFGMEAYQWLMDFQEGREALKNSLKGAIDALLFEVDWRLLIIELNRAGAGASRLIATGTSFEAGIGFMRWMDNVHLHSYDVFKEILRDPNEYERAEYKQPGIVKRSYAQQARVEKEWSFERFHRPPIRRGWIEWEKRRRYAL